MAQLQLLVRWKGGCAEWKLWCTIDHQSGVHAEVRELQKIDLLKAPVKFRRDIRRIAAP
jgi:hypothetical protein